VAKRSTSRALTSSGLAAAWIARWKGKTTRSSPSASTQKHITASWPPGRRPVRRDSRLRSRSDGGPSAMTSGPGATWAWIMAISAGARTAQTRWSVPPSPAKRASGGRSPRESK
jgi:hypothetical protein